MISLEKYIKPPKKWVTYLLINMYYPFFLWLSFRNNTGYGLDGHQYYSRQLDFILITLICLFCLTVLSYYILTNLVIFFSYRIKYKNKFLINYNIFLLLTVSIWNLGMLEYAYTKSNFVLHIILWFLWFYLLFPLIIDICKKPKRPQK